MDKSTPTPLPPKEQVEKENNEFFRRQKLFEPLVASEAWKELTLILSAQHAAQLQELVKPPGDGVNVTLVDQYRKGVVFGIQLTLKTPYATIETAKEILRELANRQPKDNSDGRPTDRFDSDGYELPDGAIVRNLSGNDE
jgi:hypothetical protein